MQDEPKNSSDFTPAFAASWMTLVSIARLSRMKSAGRVSFARMPPTCAAARKITSGFASDGAARRLARREAPAPRCEPRDHVVVSALAKRTDERRTDEAAITGDVHAGSSTHRRHRSRCRLSDACDIVGKGYMTVAMCAHEDCRLAGMAIRLGLPWDSALGPMNGRHPLVESFVRNNAAVRSEDLSLVEASPLRGTILSNLHDQIRLLSDVRDQHALIHALDIDEQIAIEAQANRYDAPLLLHTAPLYAGSQQWIFHFESFQSLFYPFITTETRRASISKPKTPSGSSTLSLESPRCLHIFSHMRQGLTALNRMAESEPIARKCHYVPIGIESSPPDAALAKFGRRPLRILFTNSLHGESRSFYLRGGHHLLEAFARLRRVVPDAELTVVSSMPDDFCQRCGPVDLDGVTWIRERLPDAELDALFLAAHVFALPSAGLHSHSLLRAMAHACVPLVTDAPGYDEYILGLDVLRTQGVRAMVYRRTGRMDKRQLRAVLRAVAGDRRSDGRARRGGDPADARHRRVGARTLSPALHRESFARGVQQHVVGVGRHASLPGRRRLS